MSGKVDKARNLIEERLSELGDERERLESALAELGGKARSRRAQRKAAAKGRPKSQKGKKRGRRSASRSEQAHAVIKANPGISASDIAKGMKMKPNYLYRLLKDLEKDGRVRKDGRRYYAD